MHGASPAPQQALGLPGRRAAPGERDSCDTWSETPGLEGVSADTQVSLTNRVPVAAVPHHGDTGFTEELGDEEVFNQPAVLWPIREASPEGVQ